MISKAKYGGALEEGVSNPAGYTVEREAITLANPVKEGYTFAGWTGTDLDGATETVTIPAFSTGDRSYTATWIANTDTRYVVEHYQQKLEDDTYVQVDRQTLGGTTGELTAAVANEYTGFTARAFEQKAIAADGTTVVEIYYDRNTYTVIWQNEGGAELEKDEGVRYGATPSYDGEIPTKAADAQYTYTFASWTPAIAEVTGDVTYTAAYSSTARSYGEPEWTWEGDDETGYTASATFTTNDGATEFSRTEPATVTSETIPASCTEDGKTVYTANVSFNGATYTKEKEVTIETTGHDWSEPTYVWAQDNSTVTATRRCPACGEEETATVETTYEVTKEPAVGVTGNGVYTATFNFDGVEYTDTKEVTIPAESPPTPGPGPGPGPDPGPDDPDPGPDDPDPGPGPIVDEFPFIDVHEEDWFYDDVYYVWEHGLMNGTAATEFSPYLTTTRGMIVTILYRLEGSPEVEGKS